MPVTIKDIAKQARSLTFHRFAGVAWQSVDRRETLPNASARPHSKWATSPALPPAA